MITKFLNKINNMSILKIALVAFIFSFVFAFSKTIVAKMLG